MSATAPLVIDVQRGMFAFADQPHDGPAVLSRIAGLVDRARAASVPVIFVQHDGGAGHPLERPGENWQIHPDTGYRPGDIVVEKRECDAFQDTELQALLDEHGVRDLTVAGMMTEYCVDTTCRRAFSLGYRVTLASDAHTTISKPHLSAAKMIEHHNQVLGSGFATARTAAEITFLDEAVS